MNLLWHVPLLLTLYMCWGKIVIFGVKSVKWLGMWLILICVAGWRIGGCGVEISLIRPLFGKIIQFGGYLSQPFQNYRRCVPGKRIRPVYIDLSLLYEHMGRRITDNYTDNGDWSVDPEIFSVCFPAGAHTPHGSRRAAILPFPGAPLHTDCTETLS